MHEALKEGKGVGIQAGAEKGRHRRSRCQKMKMGVSRGGTACGSPTIVLKCGNRWVREKKVGVLCLRVAFTRDILENAPSLKPYCQIFFIFLANGKHTT